MRPKPFRTLAKLACSTNVKSGIADAINSLPNGIKGNKGAVAETIANNVRKKIIKKHLNDPAFYDKMSVLLNEILADLRAQRISYEEFLNHIAEVAKKVQTGKADDTPEKLNTPGKRALYNNLKKGGQKSGGAGLVVETAADYKGGGDSLLDLALKIDETVRRVRPNAFRGNKTKENVIKAALLPLLDNNQAEVERIFLIIKAQTEY
jgi:type I restriction enzyme R subunit